jgi:hypothetical protein
MLLLEEQTDEKVDVDSGEADLAALVGVVGVGVGVGVDVGVDVHRRRLPWAEARFLDWCPLLPLPLPLPLLLPLLLLLLVAPTNR